MAKLDALPSLEVINTLKGTLDFYYWKGIPCVRKWPHIPHSSRTQPSLDSAHLFGLIVQGWGLVGAAAKELYWASAADQPRTGRDLYVSGVLGGQHDASMSDFLDLLIECKDYLAELQALLGPLGSVDTDDLQIDIKSALATLPVKGQDQLFSFDKPLAKRITGAISGNDGYISSGAIPGGEIWVVTNLMARDQTTGPTVHDYVHQSGAGPVPFHQDAGPFAAGEYSLWGGHLYADQGDEIRVYFTGGLVADTCRISLTGFIMTEEV